MTTSTTHSAALVGCACVLLSCSADQSTGFPTGSFDDAPLVSDCSEYPVVWHPLGRRTLVETSLMALDPQADVVWNDARDTPFRVELNVPLPDCNRDDTPLSDALWSFIEAHPGVFPLNQEDWSEPSTDRTCGEVRDDGPSITTFGRVALGPFEMRRGSMRIVVGRVDGQVHLWEVGGAYLPPATDALITSLRACPTPTEDDAWALVTQADLTYQACDNTTESRSYIANADDAFIVDANPIWSWVEAPDGLHFERHQGATYTVSPARVNPSLRASNAFCPEDFDGPDRAGWSLNFDTVLNSLLWVVPGQGCTPCTDP